MPLRFTAAALAAIALALPAIAGTWTVEKDGSGDFTVMQDAIDGAAPGDSILVAAGRYEDFRPGTSTVNGFQFQSIAWVTSPDLTLIGAGVELVMVGPADFVDEVDGLVTTCVYLDGGSNGSKVRGFTIENTTGPVAIRDQVFLGSNHINNPTVNPSVTVLEGDSVRIESCSFLVGHGLITGPQATRLQVENCTFTGIPDNDFGIVIGNGATDATIRGCTFDGMDTAIQFSLGGTGVVENCSMQEVGFAAIDLSSGAAVVRGCTVEAGARFPIRVGAGILEIYDSIIGGGELATILVWGDMFVRNSHILNDGALTVDSRGAATRTVDLVGNWWGTSDPTTISAWISDLNGNVIYEPILAGPVPTKVESVSGLKALFDELGAASQNRR